MLCAKVRESERYLKERLESKYISPQNVRKVALVLRAEMKRRNLSVTKTAESIGVTKGQVDQLLYTNFLSLNVLQKIRRWVEKDLGVK